MVDKTKFKQSAQLFAFCMQVLSEKDKERKIKDHEVGALLGLDSADCSHWKSGRKPVKSITEVYKIAKGLGVDPSIVGRVAEGQLSSQQAFNESFGYTNFTLDPREIALAKRELFCHFSAEPELQNTQEIQQLFKLDHAKIAKQVEQIHKKIGFEIAPLYLPEVLMGYPQIKLTPSVDEHQAEQGVLAQQENGVFKICYPSKTSMTPQLRFEIALALAEYFVEAPRLEHPSLSKALGGYLRHRHEVIKRQFASHLLVPAQQLIAELSERHPAEDYVEVLAEQFWVSPALIRRRIWDLLMASK